MKKALSKYFNFYVVIALIGGFSFLYLFSFAFVLNDVATGSSLKIKQKAVQKQKELCRKDPTQC